MLTVITWEKSEVYRFSNGYVDIRLVKIIFSNLFY